jgi:hypothetical protein
MRIGNNKGGTCDIESSAVCISEMLLHVSNGAYIESICLSERFLVHVEALFAGVDEIHCIYQKYHEPGKCGT